MAPSSSQANSSADRVVAVAVTGTAAAHNSISPPKRAGLPRIEGQARGLQRMVEDEMYRIDILTALRATT